MVQYPGPLPCIGLILVGNCGGYQAPLPVLGTILGINVLATTAGSATVSGRPGSVGQASSTGTAAAIGVPQSFSGGSAAPIPALGLILGVGNIGTTSGSSAVAAIYGELAIAAGSSSVTAFASYPYSAGDAAPLPALGLLLEGSTVFGAVGTSIATALIGSKASTSGTSAAGAVGTGFLPQGGDPAPFPALGLLLGISPLLSVATATGSSSTSAIFNDGDVFYSGSVGSAVGNVLCSAVGIPFGHNIGQVYGVSSAFAASSINTGQVTGSSSVIAWSGANLGVGTASGSSVVFGWSDINSGEATASGSSVVDGISTIEQPPGPGSNGATSSGGVGGGKTRRSYRNTIVGGRVIHRDEYGKIIPDAELDPSVDVLIPEAVAEPPAAATAGLAANLPPKVVTIPKPSGLSDEDFLTLIMLLEPHL